MCIIAAKYIENVGWVGVKNRDRNYKPKIEIRQSNKSGVESIYIMDLLTKFSEGLNEYGVCILTAATAVKNDESEAAAARRYEKKAAVASGTYKAPDGVKIRNALKQKTLKKAIQVLIDREFKGHTLIFNETECWLLEGGSNKEDFLKNKKASKADPDYEWEKMRYEYSLKKIPKTAHIVRTNHGHFLPWEGYQKSDIEQIKSRESSETRFKIADEGIGNATTAEEMLMSISDTSNKNEQMNPVRRGDYTDKKMLKTTGQICLIPSQKELIYIPIWCDFDASNFIRTNSSKSETFFTLKAFNPRDPGERKKLLSFKQKK